MKIVFIPGLGYNYQIFNGLTPAGYDSVFLDWMEPLRNEGIRSYAERLIASAIPPGDRLIIIGHSFGGMIAQEIASIRRVEGLILLSTITSRSEMPFWMRLIKPFRLYHLPIRACSAATVRLWGPFNGLKTAEQQSMFRKMVKRYSDYYYAWALRELSAWTAPAIPERTTVYRMHGGKDRTFPINKIKRPDVVIDGGSHLFLLEMPELIRTKIQMVSDNIIPPTA